MEIMEKKNQKRMFLYALFITLFMFNLGIFLGYMLEANRINLIENWALQTDMDILDQRIQSIAFDNIEGLDCDLMIQGNINFANKIYEEAVKIERYEKANRISGEIIIQHKKYDLLRALFWINSIKIKEQCNADYHNIVYFYDYDNPSFEQKAEQNALSNLLGGIKEKYGNKVMLIPLATDNEILSIDILKDKYNVNGAPAILIDESILLTEVQNFEEIEKYLN